MASCKDYCLHYWQEVIREQTEEVQTLIGLPYPYIVPNHQMFGEMYYWDSYFISLGLVDTPLEEYIGHCTNNLLYMMERFGRIPNTNRYFHLSRSQPPFLSAMIALTLTIKKRSEDCHVWLAEAYQVAKLDYQTVWNGRAFPDHRYIDETGLSRYYDIDIWHNAAEAESGWDMTPRFDDRCLDFCPVDLNAILYRYASDMYDFATELSLENDVCYWNNEMLARKENLLQYCKGPDGFFYDYDFVRSEQSTFKSIAGFFPLWAGMLSQEEALQAARAGLASLEVQFGVSTTEEWHPEAGTTPKQWAWPNGWAPLHWIVVSGLSRYGLKEDADRIAQKWVDTVERVYAEEGKNFEKYNVVDGQRAVPDRYPDQEGFGWTNAVYLRFLDYLVTGRSLL